jgi:hypothetical protein
MNRLKCLETAIELVTGDRERDHGNLTKNFALIAVFWGEYLGRELSPEDVAAMMILLKVSRIKSGQNNPDNWVDVAGYAACGAELTNVD